MNNLPFTFKEVKQKAKLQLNIKDYLFVSLLLILLPSINRSYITNSYEISILFYPIKFESWYLYFGLFVIIDLIKILLSYIEVNYVLDNINNKTNKSIFDYFKEVNWQNFWNYLAKIACKEILVYLGLLLFIVPGIYISYRLAFVEYVAVENKQLSVKETLKQASGISKGYCFSLFLFEVSLLGWIILEVLTLHIIDIFVIPYFAFAYANLYLGIKNL